MTEGRERQLMAQIVDGSEAAFQELAGALRPLILSVASRTLGNSSDVEDVCQTVLLAVWNGASGWNPSRGRLATWVASIARKRAIDHVRKVSRAAAMRERLTSEMVSRSMAEEGAGADDTLLRKEARQVTRRALGTLAPEQRQVIELAFFEGLSQAEVAERTGLPLGTTKARIRRGMISLRRSLPHRLAA